MSKDTDPKYSRVYHSIIDDPKFAGVYDDDRALATWLRLLILADAVWPASASLPRNVSTSALRKLIGVGLVDEVPGHRFRIHGLDTERNRRSEPARKAAAMRWHSEGNPGGPPPRNASQAKPSQDETSLAEPSPREERDILDDYYRLTSRFPTSTTKDWLTRLQAEFGLEPTSRTLARLYTEDPSPRTLLGRLENELRAEKHATERKAQEREADRLEEWNRTRHLTPEQRAENERRVNDHVAEMLKRSGAETA